MANKLSVAEEGRCPVVVGMKEGERFLLEDQE